MDRPEPGNEEIVGDETNDDDNIVGTDSMKILMVVSGMTIFKDVEEMMLFMVR